MSATQLIVALDFPAPEPALQLARSLRGSVSWVKIGLELFLSGGQPLLESIKNMGFQIFLDLKFMDIPNTVQAATAQATRLGADMLTIHTLGGEKMCRAALAGRDSALCSGQTPPLVVGVTVLTSLGPEDLVWNNEKTKDISEFIVHLTTLAQSWKLDGVVCSGQEVRALRRVCQAEFALVTPGIRLPDAAACDQARVCTPAQAMRDGSTFLVVGRPITRATDPVIAAAQYLNVMNEPFAEE